jgi:hypothetical protein
MQTLTDQGKPSGSSTVNDHYDPGLLLNSLLDRMQLTADAELAKRLRMDKRLLGKIRERRLQISGSMLMLMQEATGISIAELRCILGDRRSTSRMACKQEQRK